MPDAAVPVLLALAAACLFGVSTVTAKRGLMSVRIPRAGLCYFVLTGAIIAAAILSMYGGLATGRVVVVSPIIAAYPVFTLFTALMFKHESLSVKLAVGVFLVVAGVALVSRGAATL